VSPREHCIQEEHPLAELFRLSADSAELERFLRIVREHLGMDVAFISRFQALERVLDHVDAGSRGPLYPGQRIPLSEGYCLKVVEGELPQFIPDTSRNALAQAIPATRSIPIGSHLSVPIVMEDHSVYGTLCCFSHQPNHSLGERDMRVLRAFAEFLAVHFDAAARVERDKVVAGEQILSAMERDAPRVVYQPVYEIAGLRLHGFECLSRFDVDPRRPPDQWFRAAQEAGMGLELEIHAIEKALAALPQFPAGPCINLSCSPELILSGRLSALVAQESALARIVLEVTEHSIVRDYAALADALAPLRARGVQLAVDDAGAGYSSMRHILSLEPDIIKLDMTLTRRIDEENRRKALAKGLTSFAHEIGCLVVAEGVETPGELETLARLEVDCAQGYYLDMPLELAEALRRCTGARDRPHAQPR